MNMPGMDLTHEFVFNSSYLHFCYLLTKRHFRAGRRLLLPENPQKVLQRRGGAGRNRLLENVIGSCTFNQAYMRFGDVRSFGAKLSDTAAPPMTEDAFIGFTRTRKLIS